MRTLDAEPFNRIASDPEVRPWLGFADPLAEIDLEPVVGNPLNFCFLTDNQDGGYVVKSLAPGLYSAHTLALPSARGRPMLRLMREGFAHMFTATDCVEIVTSVPDGNDDAKSWSALAGFSHTFRREQCFPLMGDVVGQQFMSLTYQGWAFRSHDAKRAGAEFHQSLHALGLANHPDDAAHDAMVGAALLCARNHNVAKGVMHYNRFAQTAGYLPCTLITAIPPTVDTGDALVTLADGTFHVLWTKAPVAQSKLDA